MWFDANVRAEMLQHTFGVIARCLAFDDCGFAGRRESAQQHGGLYLRRRHRRLIDDRKWFTCAFEPDWQTLAFRLFDDFGTHAGEGFEHAVHRTPAQAGIAIENRRDRMTRGKAHREPYSRAGISKVDDVGGFE